MNRLPAAALGHVQTLERVLRAVVKQLRRVVLLTVAAVIAIGVWLGRDGVEGPDAVVVAILLAAPGLVFFFAQGLLELAALPQRVRGLPGEGQEWASELARVGRELRGARMRRMPLVLWRLRGAVGSARDVAGMALRFRVLTPGFLALASGALLACGVIVLLGVIALVALAAG